MAAIKEYLKTTGKTTEKEEHTDISTRINIRKENFDRGYRVTKKYCGKKRDHSGKVETSLDTRKGYLTKTGVHCRLLRVHILVIYVDTRMLTSLRYRTILDCPSPVMKGGAMNVDIILERKSKLKRPSIHKLRDSDNLYAPR